MDNLITLLDRFSAPLWAVFIVVILGFFISNLENLLLLKGKICEWFSKVSTKAGKVALSSKVKGSILKATHRFDDFEKDILPSDIKIKWVENEEEESFIKNNQAVVCVRRSNNPQENLILATAAYVNEGLLHNYRRYLDSSTMKASNFAMIKKIIQESGRNAVTFFEEEYVPKYILGQDDVYEMYQQLKILDKNGMFLHVLLKEYIKAADGVFGDTPDPCLKAESREIVRFLYNIATRETNDNTELCLNTNYFKIAIILTAKEEVFKKAGVNPYIKRIKKFMNDEIETIYMFGIGRKIMAAEEIAKRINADETAMYWATQRRYNHVFNDGRKKQAVVYEISSKF